MAHVNGLAKSHESAALAAHTTSEFEALSRVARMVELKKKRPIYLAGDPGDAVYLVKAGRVKISSCDHSGKAVTFSILKPGDIFGEVEALEGTPRETSAEALDDVRLGVISRQDLLQHLQEHPELTLALTKVIGARLRELQNRVEDLVFRDVPSRLAHLLQQLGEPAEVTNGSGRRVRAQLTHQELANLIGCNRETVSAILGQFRAQGLIRLDRCSITILNMDRVANLVV